MLGAHQLPNESVAAAALRHFFDVVGEEIHTLDPNHLVENGFLGGGQCGTESSDYQYVSASPASMAAWGLIVAVLLVLGSLPFFLGLAVVIPLLGHATWHLYRKVIAPDPNPQPIPARPLRQRRSAADFPAALFPWRRKDPS